MASECCLRCRWNNVLNRSNQNQMNCSCFIEISEISREKKAQSQAQTNESSYLFHCLNQEKSIFKSTRMNSISTLTLFEGSKSSTSKFDVSLGLVTTGIYGAVTSNDNGRHRIKDEDDLTHLDEDHSNRSIEKMDDFENLPVHFCPNECRSNREDAVRDLWHYLRLQYRLEKGEASVKVKRRKICLFNPLVINVMKTSFCTCIIIFP
jgi:hypothetical protein